MARPFRESGGKGVEIFGKPVAGSAARQILDAALVTSPSGTWKPVGLACQPLASHHSPRRSDRGFPLYQHTPRGAMPLVLRFTSHQSRIRSQESPVTAVLIGTPERLEMRVTHRKQTTGCRSNRYTSHPPISRSLLARAARGILVLASNFQPLTSRTTRDTRTSRIARKLLKTKDRHSFYPRQFSSREMVALASSLELLERCNLWCPGRAGSARWAQGA